MVSIKFVKTNDKAVLPKQNHVGRTNGDSGYDLFSVEDITIPAKSSKVVPVGLRVGYIQPGFWFKIESRSGLSFKHGILAHPGIVDNMYRGDCGVLLYNHSSNDVTLKEGTAIAQMVIYPLIVAETEWVDEVHETVRGEKGFGSSDKEGSVSNA